MTALHLAAEEGSADVVAKILSNSSNSEIVKECQNVAGQLKGNSKCKDLILNYCAEYNKSTKKLEVFIEPAKWSDIIPNSWVKKLSECEMGVYWKERDALIEVIMDKFLPNDAITVTSEGVKVKIDVVGEVMGVLTSHKDEIKEFLRENYNVAPDVIKEKLTKSVNSKESFVEKLEKERKIDSNLFNVK